MKSKPLVLGFLGLALAGGLGWGAWVRYAGRPLASGAVQVAGVGAKTEVRRLETGGVVIVAQNELDAVRGLGFAHASDRAWQMDLARRTAQGTRAAILGRDYLAQDTEARLRGFARRVDEVWERLPQPQRARLAAYAEGVNAGLHSIGGRSAMHRALGAEMASWKPTDAILVAYAQFLSDEVPAWRRDQRLGEIRARLDLPWARFFSDPEAAPELPGPKFLNLAATLADEEKLPPPLKEEAAALVSRELRPGTREGVISNVDDAGKPSVDVRLRNRLGLPTPWYFASLRYPAADGQPRTISGFSLAGLPLTLIGSNGQLAWGVVPLHADIDDLVLLPRSDIDPDVLYVQEKKILKLESRQETIEVRGDKPETVTVLESVWGPVVGRGEKQQYLALQSTTANPNAINFFVADLETATSSTRGAGVASQSALWPMRIVLTDTRGGVMVWAVGRVPERVGFDGDLPVFFAYGDRSWAKLVPAPPYTTRGAGGALCSPTGEAVSRWTETLTQTLRQPAPAGKEDAWRKFSELLSKPREAYVLSEAFGRHARARILGPILRHVTSKYEEFEYGPLPADQVALRIFQAKPVHLLDPRYGTWEDVLLNALADTTEDTDEIEKALSSTREIAPSTGLHLPWRARLPLLGLGLPLGEKAHLETFPSSRFLGEDLRVVVNAAGDLRFSAPGGPSEHPGSPGRSLWHDAWRKEAWLTVPSKATGSDAVLLQP